MTRDPARGRSRLRWAKTHPSRLVERVEAGEEIVIRRSGRPVARLVPLRRVDASRTPGPWRGEVTIHDDFDQPPEELAAAFDGRAP